MELKSKKYLDDILNAIELIQKFLVGINYFTEYSTYIKTQSAVERQLGIIGEAVNQFDKLNPNDFLKNTVQIVGLRNRIIHAYDSIDNTVIWAIIQKHLPDLKSEVIQKLA